MHEHRFYRDAAPWWPLISPPEEYAEEAAFVQSLFRAAGVASGELLELGSGGGHNASHLRSDHAMTLVDISPDMLDVSRLLNPDCEHVLGDMRTVRLDRSFDGVFLHDAVVYMLDEEDLHRAMQTAYVHCRPGGVVVIAPDHTSETFESSTEHGGHDHRDGRAARYLEWTWDPDPGDGRVQSEYVLLLRSADGTVQTIRETHHAGLFDRSTWLSIMESVGFEAEAVMEATAEERSPRMLFVGRRPGGQAPPTTTDADMPSA